MRLVRSAVSCQLARLISPSLKTNKWLGGRLYITSSASLGSKEVTALTQGQVSHIISQMEEASIDIGALNQTNQNLLLVIDVHEKEARERWDEASSGWSAWEQIALWASIATEAVIIVAVTTCLCKMYCRVLGRNGAAVVVSTDNELSGLRDHILDLEANILLNKRPKAKALALTREADIESAD